MDRPIYNTRRSYHLLMFSQCGRCIHLLVKRKSLTSHMSRKTHSRHRHLFNVHGEAMSISSNLDSLNENHPADPPTPIRRDQRGSNPWKHQPKAEAKGGDTKRPMTTQTPHATNTSGKLVQEASQGCCNGPVQITPPLTHQLPGRESRLV
jgi:hypothetical protein